MSDALKHECGIALVRLLKPLEYYKEKYGTAFYGVNKMYLMMEKQHNRGQDGAEERDPGPAAPEPSREAALTEEHAATAERTRMQASTHTRSAATRSTAAA